MRIDRFFMHHSPKGVVPFLKILYLLLIIHFLQNTADLQVGAGARFKHWLCYTQAKNNSNLFWKETKANCCCPVIGHKQGSHPVSYSTTGRNCSCSLFELLQVRISISLKSIVILKKLALTISHRLPEIYNPDNRGFIVWFLNISE